MKIVHGTHHVDIEKDYRLLQHLKYQLRKNFQLYNKNIVL